MNITMSGKNLTIGDQLKQRIESKLSKLDRFFGEEAQAQVKARAEGDDKIMEITIRVKSHIYRAEASASDIFTALDVALSNMERQIRKQKSRIEKKIRDYAYMKEALREQSEHPEDLTGEPQILRRKSFDLPSMSPEEATLQMELLGHSFHLFFNGETGKVALVYKRKDGNYGLIEPEY